MAWVRVQTQFAMIRAVDLCLRGTPRCPVGLTLQEDGAGLRRSRQVRRRYGPVDKTTVPFTLTLKIVYVKQLHFLLLLSTCAFSVISHFHLLFLSFSHARSFIFSSMLYIALLIFQYRALTSGYAGPDKWIRRP